MSQCYICKIEQTLENSGTRLTSVGNVVFKSRCKKCDKEYMHKYNKNWYPKNKDRKREITYAWRENNPEKEKAIQQRQRKKYSLMLKDLKSNGCAICGYDKCVRSLDFHHVESKTKKFSININTVPRHSSQNIADEVCKCVLLCRNCHGEIHEKEYHCRKD